MSTNFTVSLVALMILLLPGAGNAQEEVGETCEHGGQDGYELSCTQHPLSANHNGPSSSYVPPDSGDGPSRRAFGGKAALARPIEEGLDMPGCVGVVPNGQLARVDKTYRWGYWIPGSWYGFLAAPVPAWNMRNISYSWGFWLFEKFDTHVSGSITIAFCYDGTRVVWARPIATWSAVYPWFKRVPTAEIQQTPVPGQIPVTEDRYIVFSAHFEKCPVRNVGRTAGVTIPNGVSGGSFVGNLCVDGLDVAFGVTVTAYGQFNPDTTDR